MDIFCLNEIAVQMKSLHGLFDDFFFLSDEGDVLAAVGEAVSLV